MPLKPLGLTAILVSGACSAPPPPDLTDTAPLAVDQAAAPLPQTMVLTTVTDPIVVGETMTLWVDNAPAWERILVAEGEAAGNGPCPRVLGRLCLGVTRPSVLGSARADVFGRARIQVTAPPEFAQQTHTFLQAVYADDLNSQASGVLQVAIDPGAPSPDLQPVLVSLPPQAEIGAELASSFDVRVDNLGDAASGPVDVTVYLSADGILDATDVAFTGGAVTLPDVPAGGSASVVFPTLQLPGSAVPGNARVIAVVDEAGLVEEADESNNIAGGVVEVVEPPPEIDVTPTFTTVPGAALTDGTALDTVVVQVSNLGPDEVSLARVQLYLSADAVFDPSDLPLVNALRSAGPIPGGSSADATFNQAALPAGTAAGAWNLLAVADPDDLLAETDETNGVAVAGIVAADPIPHVDFKPTLTVSPGTAEQGEDLTGAITVSVENRGQDPSGATNVAIYISDDAILDPTDTRLVGPDGTLGPLGAGASADAVFAGLAMPADAPLGNGRFIAVVDPDDTVLESNETNNQSLAAVAVTEPPADVDLRVELLTAPPYTLQGALDIGQVAVRVHNDGPDDAPNHALALFLSADATWDAGDVELTSGRKAVNGLLASTSRDLTFNTAALPLGTATGPWQLLAVADPDVVLVETDTTNNVAASPLAVVDPADDKDLRPAFTLAPTTVELGASLDGEVGVRVYSEGTADTEASTVALYLSADAIFDPGDLAMPTGTAAVAALTAGTSVLVPFQTLGLPAGATAGAWNLLAVVDPDGTLAETDEADNVVATALTLTEPLAGPEHDLRVAVLSSPASVQVGSSLAGQVTLQVFSEGADDTPVSAVALYLSTDTTLDGADLPLLDGTNAVAALTAGTSTVVGFPSLGLPAGATAGAWNLLAVVDPDDTLAETDETDNVASAALTLTEPPPEHDLRVAVLSSPASVQVGDSLAGQVTVQIYSEGTDDTPVSAVALYLSTDTTLDGADLPLVGGTNSVAALTAGTSTVVGFPALALPAGASAGAWNLLAVVDPDDTLPETDETDNVASAALTLTEPPPEHDLRVAVLSSPASVQVGDSLAGQVTVQIYSEGTDDTPVSAVALYLSTDTTLDGADLPLVGGTNSVAALTAGTSTVVGFPALALPAGASAGAWNLLAVVDPDDTLPETDETDNVASAALTLTDPPPEHDLRVSGLSAPGSIEVTEPLDGQVTLRVHSEGTDDTPASTVQLLLSSDATPDAGDAELIGGTLAVPALTAGTFVDLTPGVLDLPASATPGSWFVLAVVDPDNTLAETDESDNVDAVATSVYELPDQIDLRPVFTAAPTTVELGQPLDGQVGVRVLNDGTDASGATTVDLYLSADTTLDPGDLPLPQGMQPVGSLPGGQSTVVTWPTLSLPGSATPGTWYLLAVTDPDDLVTETDETNGVVASALELTQPVPEPDLRPAYITAPTTAEEAASLSGLVSVRVYSEGNDPHPADEIVLYLSTDGAFDPSDLVLVNATQPVPAMSPGQSAVISFPGLALPPTAGPGAWTLLAVVDPDDTLAELDESDNVAASALTLTAAPTGVNVAISGLVGPAVASVGQPVGALIDIDVHNGGPDTAPSVTVALYVSADTAWDAGDTPLTLGSQATDTIPGGSTLTIDGGSSAIPAVVPGTWWLLAVADPGQVLDDPDRSDNVGSWQIQLVPPSLDEDHDGLTTSVETALGTDPFDADSDGDGVHDGWEVEFGRNPTGADAAPTPARVVAGSHAMCVLMDDGSPTCFGMSSGRGLDLPPAPYVDLAIGGAAGCGLRDDGGVSCAGLLTTGAPTGSNFVEVEAGQYFACALDTDSLATCWGLDQSGETLAPSGTFLDLGLSWITACGLRSDHTTECWGSSSQGLTSPPTATMTSIATTAEGTSLCGEDEGTGELNCWGSASTGITSPPGGLLDDPAIGTRHACALDGLGNATCWGQSLYGETVPPAETFASVAAGRYWSCGLTTGGEVRCWGSDGTGARPPIDQTVADVSLSGSFGPLLCRTTPAGELICDGQLSAPTSGSYASVATGLHHSCALRTTGGIDCWGTNSYGQTNAPVGSFDQVVVGNSHTCALDDLGGIVCWGSDSVGQSTPPTGTFASVYASWDQSCALDALGEAHCWGANPTVTPAAGPFAELSIGFNAVCGVRLDGTIACWGSDSAKILSEAPSDAVYTDVVLAASAAWALTDSGLVVGWGNGAATGLPATRWTLASLGTTSTVSFSAACGISTDGREVCWGDVVRGLMP